MTSDPGEIRRFYIKHKAEPTYFAIEADENGYIGALEVSDAATKGGLCPHVLATLPMNDEPGLLRFIEKSKTEFTLYEPECGNVHHLMADLIELEKDYRATSQEWETLDAQAKALKKLAELKGEKVHRLLGRIYNRPRLPLFDDVPAEPTPAPEPVHA